MADGSCGEAAANTAQPRCGCGASAALVSTLGAVDTWWADGVVDTPVGPVPRVRTALGPRDRLGTLRVRCAIGRMDYRVTPGLYAVGNPTADSPVFVSANYKMSFDRLRSALAGRDGWLLVLDTHGINVWCAAGKGTFGTAEVVRRVAATGLARVVSHRRLVLPQLSATGVSAHEVRRTCGFSVVYGPVRAEDLPAFLDRRMKADEEMRRVQFRLRDRAVLIPVDLVAGASLAVPLAAGFLLLGGLGPGGYSVAGVRTVGIPNAAILIGSYLAAVTLGPLLLPWLPARAFALKGAWLGAAIAASMAVYQVSEGSLFASPLHAAAWMLLTPTVASFVVMTFTGSSTFTSLSGVRREMRIAVPLQIAAGVAGIGLWFAGLFR